MIIRVVKMTISSENIAAFEQLFEERKAKIRQQEGCTHLQLWQEKGNSQVFFTYSHWVTESYLQQYRNSDFFKDTWSKTKALFSERAQAWTVEQKAKLS